MSQSAPIHVITLADERFAMPLAVMVRSLLDRLEADRSVHVTIIDGGFLDLTRDQMIESWNTSAGWQRCSLEWRPPDYGEGASIPTWGRLPKLTYARLNLAAYLPGVTRAIFLDSDILVRTGIGRLWDTPLAGSVAAAVIDPFLTSVSSPQGLEAHAAAGLASDAPYLNAGLMLVDLELWRERNVGPRAWAFVNRNWRTLPWYDQDALNSVLAGEWRPLDSRWQIHPRLAALRSSGETRANDAWIVHFSGRLKPWVYRGGSPADQEFFEVLDRTEWRGWRPPVTGRSMLTGLYERKLRRLFYPVEVRALGLLSRVRRSREAGKDR